MDREHQRAACLLRSHLFLHSDHILELLMLCTCCVAADETRMQPSAAAVSMKHTAGTVSYQIQFYFPQSTFLPVSRAVNKAVTPRERQ